MSPIKIAYVSSMLPGGHYSQSLCRALAQQPINLLVYTDRQLANLKIKDCGQVKAVWTKDLRYIFQITWQIIKDQPDIVHVQHEFNMYGGLITAIFFPLLLLILKVLRIRTVITIHAVPDRKLIDDQFLKMFFSKPPIVMRPAFIRVGLDFLYRLIGLFSHQLVVHNRRMKLQLVNQYQLSSAKINVVPPLIEMHRFVPTVKEKFFLFFGYIVGRKGLEILIDAFAHFWRRHLDYRLILAGGTIAGQKQTKQEIVKFIKRKGLTKAISLIGFIEEKDFAQYFLPSQAVLLPAILSVSSSGPLTHAWSFHKCVLASNIGNYSCDIDNGVNGILVDNNAWQGILEKIVYDNRLVEKIEQGARTTAKKRHPQQIGALYYHLYQQLLNET